jgi:hypothetical protein
MTRQFVKRCPTTRNSRCCATAGAGLVAPTPGEINGGPAEVLGLTYRATLEPGKRADFLALDADPPDDIVNTSQITAVYFAGHALDRERLRTVGNDRNCSVSCVGPWRE